MKLNLQGRSMFFRLKFYLLHNLCIHWNRICCNINHISSIQYLSNHHNNDPCIYNLVDKLDLMHIICNLVDDSHIFNTYDYILGNYINWLHSNHPNIYNFKLFYLVYKICICYYFRSKFHIKLSIADILKFKPEDSNPMYNHK